MSSTSHMPNPINEMIRNIPVPRHAGILPKQIDTEEELNQYLEKLGKL